MRTLYFHNSISIKQVLFLWLTLCLLPAIAQAGSSHQHAQNYDQDKHEYQELDKKDCDNSLTVPLLISGKTQVGVVKVSYDEYNLSIKYIANDGWLFEKTHLAVADSFAGLPQDRYGNPKLRRFPYKTNHKKPVTVVNQMLSTRLWPIGTELYIAAHVDVVALKPMHRGNKRFKADSWSGRWSKSVKYASKSDKQSFNHYTDHSTNKYHRKQSKFQSFKRFTEKFFNKYDGSDDHRHTTGCVGKDKQHWKKHTGGKTKSAWAKGFAFPGGKDGFYFTYLLKSCEPPMVDSTIQFSMALYNSSEDETTATVTVTRNGSDLSTPATVRVVTADGSAEAGIDYGMIDQQVTFAPNETQIDILIPVIDDSEAEETETVNLQLLDVQGASLGEQDTAVLEIADNEPAVFIFAPAEYAVEE
ncbi:Calx-beta domain-containing protein, partial [Kaarinaea lacus]